MNDNQSDFITHLFDAISGDPSMPAELKISLLRLQLPVHKLSQTDPHFMSNERHPARRIFFIAKRICTTLPVDASLISKIDLIISSLIKSAPTATNFAQTNQRLQQLMHKPEPGAPEQTPEQTPEQAPGKTLGEAQQTSPAPDKLKQQFNRMIKVCIQGHKIPPPCQHLVLKLWPNALFHLFKTHGEQSPHWVNAITLFCELLASIQPVLNIEQYRHLKDTFMDCARKNNNMLLQFHNSSVVETDIKTLINYYNQVLGSAHYVTQSTNSSPMSILDKISSLPVDIKPGIWCEIYIDEITPARRLRLSLINVRTGSLIFVNRKGIKKVEKDAFEFSEELKRGLSRIYNHDALFSKPSSKAEYKKIG
ncbi:hypothetical protein MNBD_GAMMA10-2248 [hydrothermal vent metagenome]|uniref:Uncharacterized protein n=1 Tax=hydrothermal vent metagenome TaxID=652676 RepID=A0A3B0XYC3_9ZZZZ